MIGLSLGLSLGGLSHTAMALPGKIARRVGFDTDGDSDIDDVLAFAILAEMAALGEASVQFITACTTLEASAPAFKALAVYSGLGTVPVGTRKTALENASTPTSAYAGPIRAAFRVGDTGPNYPDAVLVMRQALADTPDGAGFSIIVAGTGENVADLIASPADAISPMTGLALMQAKGVTLHIMGGAFVTTSYQEHNISYAPNAANAIAAAAIPKIYAGYEVGNPVATRYPTASTDPTKDPYRVGWNAYGVTTRPSWDLIATMEAVRGAAGGLWSYSAPGDILFGGTPYNSYTANAAGSCRYLVKVATDAAIAAYLNAMIDSAALRFDHDPVTVTTLASYSVAQGAAGSIQLTATQQFTASLLSGTASGFSIQPGNILQIEAKSYNSGGNNAYTANVRYTDPSGNVADKSVTITISQYNVESETASYLAAMTAAPDATRIGHLDTLIKAAKTAGVWTKIDQLALLASHDAQSALINAADPAGAPFTLSGTVSLVVDRGGQGDGVAGHIVFPKLAVVTGGKSTQNSIAVGAWCNLQGSGTGQQNHIGGAGSSFQNYVGAATSGVNESYRANDAVTTTARTGAGRTGHRMSARGASGVKRSYLNGSGVVTAAQSSAAPNATALVALRNNSGYSTDRLAVIYQCADLTDQQAADWHAALNVYLTAIGAA